MSHGIRPTGHRVRIKREKCVHCGRCLKVCPRKNFRKSADAEIEVVDTSNCNGCTKCRDACLTKAIVVAAEPLKKYEYTRQVQHATAKDTTAK
jgi:Pyruvate/2-oxoacid:ferredoxin oxidoreductase delta subunit